MGTTSPRPAIGQRPAPGTHAEIHHVRALVHERRRHALFYRAWRPSAPAGKILVLFHRGHEHSGRWEDVVDALAPEGFTVFAWDARGNGRSEGPRDDAENFGCYARDAELFVRHLSETEGVPMEQIAVVGHSVGAAIVAAWIHDYAPRLRAAVLATPAFRIRLYLPLAIPSLRMAQKLRIMKFVPSYVKARVLTHDPAQRVRHEQDSLISHGISSQGPARSARHRHAADSGRRGDPRAHARARRRAPTGSSSAAAQMQFFERLGSPVKHLEMLPGYYHDVYHEQRRRAAAAADARVHRGRVRPARRTPRRCSTPTRRATPSRSTARCRVR